MKVLVDTSIWSLALRRHRLATEDRRVVEEFKDPPRKDCADENILNR